MATLICVLKQKQQNDNMKMFKSTNDPFKQCEQICIIFRFFCLSWLFPHVHYNLTITLEQDNTSNILKQAESDDSFCSLFQFVDYFVHF